jgi:hypothetical protein
MTRAPFLARATAAAWPIPVPAPVIQATLFFRDSSIVPPYGDPKDVPPANGISNVHNFFKN